MQNDLRGIFYETQKPWPYLQPTFAQEIMREIDQQGHLSAFTSIGCYTIMYVTHGGDVLCANCAEESLLAEEDDVACARGTYDEGPILVCANCEEAIESSYGDPVEED